MRSFGPLPAAEDPEILGFWGAGGLTLGSDGSLIYTRRLPYEIYFFDTFGRERRETIVAPFEATHTPADAFVVQPTEGGGVNYSLSEAPAMKPVPAKELVSGWLVAGRVIGRGEERFVDLFDPDGSWVASVSLPGHLRSIVGLDRDGGFLWLKGERHLEPVFFRISVDMTEERGVDPEHLTPSE